MDSNRLRETLETDIEQSKLQVVDLLYKSISFF